MKKMIIALILCLSMCLSNVAFATEIKPTETQQKSESTASERATYYESRWFDTDANGNFSIYCGNSGSVGVTIKLESTDSDAFCMVQLFKSNGQKVMPSAVTLSPSRPEYYTHFNLQPGTYYVQCLGYSNTGMRIMCWMY